MHFKFNRHFLLCISNLIDGSFWALQTWQNSSSVHFKFNRCIFLGISNVIDVSFCASWTQQMYPSVHFKCNRHIFLRILNLTDVSFCAFQTYVCMYINIYITNWLSPIFVCNLPEPAKGMSSVRRYLRVGRSPFSNREKYALLDSFKPETMQQSRLIESILLLQQGLAHCIPTHLNRNQTMLIPRVETWMADTLVSADLLQTKLSLYICKERC